MVNEQSVYRKKSLTSFGKDLLQLQTEKLIIHPFCI